MASRWSHRITVCCDGFRATNNNEYKEKAMLKKLIPAFALATAITAPALAQNVTYTKDIAPVLKEYCSECHGDGSPIYKEFKKNEAKLTKEKIGPRMDSFPLMVTHIVYPETGALQRRLDDGKASPGGKPGNMYRYLGGDEQERQKNLALFKAWLGEGGWNLNRWAARGDVPAITKEQLDKLKLAY
jgi:hypothetical protein